MRNLVARGYKLALVVLGLELVLAPALLSNSVGLFAIIAMTGVGIAWLPAAVLIVSDLRRESVTGFFAYLLAGLCGVIGAACLYLFANWTLLALIAW